MAAYMGNLRTLEILHEDFPVNLEVKNYNGLNVMHASALTDIGVLGILYYHKFHRLDINVRDNFQATPLHHAI